MHERNTFTCNLNHNAYIENIGKLPILTSKCLNQASQNNTEYTCEYVNIFMLKGSFAKIQNK